MTKQKGICQNPDCDLPKGKEYEYDYNPKYPRKYCPECSAKKKQEYEDNTAKPLDSQPEVVRPGEVTESEGMKQQRGLPKLGQFDKDPVGLVVELMCAGRHTVEEAIRDVKQAMKELQ